MVYKGLCLRQKKDFEWVNVEIPKTLDVQFFVPVSEKDIITRGKSAQFIIASSHNPPLGVEIFEQLIDLKVVQLTGAGFDKVDLVAAARHGIPVAHAPDQNTRSVAQYVFIMIGVLLRRMFEGHHLVYQGKYLEARKTLATPTLHELGGQNLGIIGMGRIGQEVARIGNFFGYHIGYYDIRKLAPADEANLEATYFDRESIFRWADVISLHLPLTSTTRALVSENEFKRMKQSALLINISRGGIVDEYALSEALEENRIWGAGVDVFADEPPPAGHPFFRLNPTVRNRLLLSPHMGGRTFESNNRMFSFAIENVRAFLVDGKPLQCVVNSSTVHKES